MFKKYLLFNIVFILILIIELLQLFNLSFLPTWFILPIFTGIAGLWLILKTKLRGRFHRRMLVALLSFIVGTLLLGRPGESALIYIFISFFIAQVSLIRAFYLDFRSAPELDKRGARVAIILGILFSFSTYLFLRPYLGAYKIPVLIFSFLTALLMMMAFFRRFRVNQLSFTSILLGSMFFAVATFVSAIDHFIADSPYIKVVIDTAYLFSIYLMVMGATERQLILKDN